MIEVNIKGDFDKVLLTLENMQPTKKFGSQMVRTAALVALTEMKGRIGDEGKASDGGKIGQYSTKPTYISKDQSPKSFGRPLGKMYNGKRRSVFASTGQDHKSRYFAGGYREFKTAIGRNLLDSVNLTLTGQFLNSFTLIPSQKGWGLGWGSLAFVQRARGFEAKYNKAIFNLSPRERKAVIREIKIMLNNAFS